MRRKKIIASPFRKKKTHQLVAEEKKNSTASWPGKKKLNCRLARKKKHNCRLARKKKTKREFSARGPPQIINGPSLNELSKMSNINLIYQGNFYRSC